MRTFRHSFNDALQPVPQRKPFNRRHVHRCGRDSPNYRWWLGDGQADRPAQRIPPIIGLGKDDRRDFGLQSMAW